MMEDSTRIGLVSVLSSARAPESISAFAASLPDWLPVPVMWTILHDQPEEHEGLLECIGLRCAMPVKTFDDHVEFEGGCIYVAPAQTGVCVRSGEAAAVKVDGAPIVKTLLRSTASAYRSRALVVLLDGVVDEARDAVRKVVWAGGQVFAHLPDSREESLVRTGIARAYSAPDILGEAIALVCTRSLSLRAV